MHTRGALMHNHFVNKMKLAKKIALIRESDKIKFIHLKTPNPLKDSVISFPIRLPKEFGLQQYIDYETQFEKAFIEPMKIILDCINWKIEKENSIESFFG